MWEGRLITDIREQDIRQLVASGVQEYLQLDYKQGLYEDKKEFLLDVCQFANAAGGILLIGIQELREGGKPTGVPDREAELGIELVNREAELLKLDAWVTTGIEETLHIESNPIDMGNNRWVLAIRVPNSTRKPHSVYFEKGRIYFPYRRERSRDYLDVRDIKEMVMRTASRVEQAEKKLQR
jgi:predicted HTH transcriptional regulator